MKILTLSKKEAQDVLSNRIYILVVFVQVIIILGAFGLVMVSSIVTDPNLLDQWGGNTILKVGVTEDLKGTALEQNLKDQNLNVVYFKTIDDGKSHLGSDIVAFVYISDSKGNIGLISDNGNVFYPVVNQKLANAINSYTLEQKLSTQGFSSQEIETIKNPIILKEVGVHTNSSAKIALDSSYFVEIMYGFIVPFVLLLPFFLASNIVTDSIVGEKERKTFEVLLMTPLSSTMVIMGKILPILMFSLIQSGVWILMLEALKVPIYHSLLLLVLLFFVGLGFIGMGVLISMLVDSTKEANSAITLLLFLATFVLFVPLFMDIPSLNSILNWIPTVLIVKMSSTPYLSPELLLAFIPSIVISLLIFVISVRFFRQEGAIRL